LVGWQQKQLLQRLNGNKYICRVKARLQRHNSTRRRVELSCFAINGPLACVAVQRLQCTRALCSQILEVPSMT